MKRFTVLSVLLLVLVASVVVAQEDTTLQIPINDTVSITWPLPVTEVWGTTDVLGTAAAPGMAYYYLEYVGLNDDMTIPENAPWLPATVAIFQTVVNDSLATLDTELLPDGVYALRLTINTYDGQSFYDVVAPIRVNNERFRAVLPRDEENIPTPVPTQVPVDTTPRVVVSPQLNAVNIRRCDLVDNDRCPVIGILLASDTALVQATSSRGSGWFEIQLPSGVVGWVSPTVVTQQGDFSAVGTAQPPDPLPRPSRPQSPDNVPRNPRSAVLPNGMAIAGGSATCNRPFDVQINITNPGDTAASGGTVTLQDVNISAGEVTFTGDANYPALDPHANYVVVIPVRTSGIYSAGHELRAYANGHQLNIRYRLQQGNCDESRPPRNNQRTQRSFRSDECSIEVTRRALAYARPQSGEDALELPQGTYRAEQVRRLGGMNWYQISIAGSNRWVAGPTVTKHGSCNLNP